MQRLRLPEVPRARGGLEVSRFGSSDTHGTAYDGVHYRGASGTVANTRSLIDILASAGLATPVPRDQEQWPGQTSQGQTGRGQTSQTQPWQQQGRRKGGRAKGQRRIQPFELALRNRFQGN